MPNVPNRIVRGGEITAAWLNTLRDAVAEITPRTSNDIGVSTSSAGATFKVLNPTIAKSILPSFYVYPSGSPSKVKVTGGNLIHVFNKVNIEVADSSELTVSNNDHVWVERTGNNAWAFSNGAAYPTTKIFVPLADVTVSDDVVAVDHTNGWSGGDLIIAEAFPVTVSQSGGSAGSITADCSYTYTVTTLGGIQIMSGATPQATRFPHCEYTAGTKGFACLLASGAFDLIWVNEYAKTDEVTMQSQYRIDTANNKFQVKYRKLLVLESGAEDANWTDVHTGTTC